MRLIPVLPGSRGWLVRAAGAVGRNLGDHLLPVSWCCQSHGGGLTSSRLHAETEHGHGPRRHQPRDLYAGRQLAGARCPLYTKINGCKLTLISGLGIRTAGIREPASTVISAAAWPEVAGHQARCKYSRKQCRTRQPGSLDTSSRRPDILGPAWGLPGASGLRPFARGERDRPEGAPDIMWRHGLYGCRVLG
jgi:hypothetical protein